MGHSHEDVKSVTGAAFCASPGRLMMMLAASTAIRTLEGHRSRRIAADAAEVDCKEECQRGDRHSECEAARSAVRCCRREVPSLAASALSSAFCVDAALLASASHLWG
jgi:hypothetical protein